MRKIGAQAAASKRKEWNGIKYTLGPTNIRIGYDVELNGNTFDFLTPFFEEVGVRWSRIREPTDALFIKGKLVNDFLGEGVEDMPFPKDTKEKFREAWAHLEALLKSADCPIVPIEANGARALKQDRHSLGDLLHKFGPEVGKVMDLMSRSIFGGSAHEISAFAALSYLRGEFSERYGAAHPESGCTRGAPRVNHERPYQNEVHSGRDRAGWFLGVRHIPG